MSSIVGQCTGLFCLYERDFRDVVRSISPMVFLERLIRVLLRLFSFECKIFHAVGT